MTLIDSLPQEVKSLIPKENADFCHSLSAEEAEHLKELLGKHKSFCNIDGLMEDCHGACSSLHGKFQTLLGANSARLAGLSDGAKAFAKECMGYVCEVQQALLHGKAVDSGKAGEIRSKFSNLSSADQEALKKNNPDIQF